MLAEMECMANGRTLQTQGCGIERIIISMDFFFRLFSVINYSITITQIPGQALLAGHVEMVRCFCVYFLVFVFCCFRTLHHQSTTIHNNILWGKGTVCVCVLAVVNMRTRTPSRMTCQHSNISLNTLTLWYDQFLLLKQANDLFFVWMFLLTLEFLFPAVYKSKFSD